MKNNKLNNEVMQIFYDNQKDVEDVINIFYRNSDISDIMKEFYHMASLGEMMRNPVYPYESTVIKNPYHPYIPTVIKDSGIRIK